VTAVIKSIDDIPLQYSSELSDPTSLQHNQYNEIIGTKVSSSEVGSLRTFKIITKILTEAAVPR